MKGKLTLREYAQAFKRYYSDGMSLALAVGGIAILGLFAYVHISEHFNKEETQSQTEREKEGNLPKVVDGR